MKNIMYERFLEIAFEAEVNIEEDPELLEMAQELCDEHQATRSTTIADFRKMIFEQMECLPYRTDDEFLLRFLRSKKFNVRRAYKLMIRYCNFREEHKQLYKDVNLWDLAKVKKAYECNISDRPDAGRIFILRFGMWDTNECTIDDMARAATAIIEIGLRQPRIQVLGVTVIADLEGVTIRHITAMTPRIVLQCIGLMGLAVPGRLNSIHVVNYSWMLNSVFYLFRRFISQQAWNSIYFHGRDLKSLHRYVDVERLPPRLGGISKSIVYCEHWFNKIKKYRTEQFDKDMKQLGYIIKE